jgi:hypothetical protein
MNACQAARRSRRVLACSAIVAAAIASAAASTMGAGLACDAGPVARARLAAAMQTPVRWCAGVGQPARPGSAPAEAVRTPLGTGQRMPAGTNLARNDAPGRAAG